MKRKRCLKVHMILDRSNAGIVGSNLTGGRVLCLRFSVLFCPVYVGALRWVYPLSDPYQNVSEGFIRYEYEEARWPNTMVYPKVSGQSR
jgi:hypothetical protein